MYRLHSGELQRSKREAGRSLSSQECYSRERRVWLDPEGIQRGLTQRGCSGQMETQTGWKYVD